jgi:type I restriction enzyme S subunit
LRVAEVHDGFITPSFGDHVHENFRSKFAAKMSAAGDIVVTTKGTVGRVALMREDHPEFVYSPQVCFFRCSAGSGIAPEWLYFWFKGPEFMVQALGVQSQTDMAPYINLADMRSISITVPPMREQRAIADVLGALDDKIESNRRLCGVVDGLIRAELENLADLPSSEKITVGELAERIHKPVDPQKLPPSTNYIGLEHMPRGLMILDEWGTAEGLDSGKSHFEEADVLFGKLRPNFRKVGVSPVSGICSTDILVLRPKSGFSTALLLAVVSSEQVLGPAIAASSGTKMPRISWDYMADLKVQIPDEIGCREFSDRVDPMVQRVLKAVRETQILTETRGALLPELLSGRLRVSDAEKVVEGAV